MRPGQKRAGDGSRWHGGVDRDSAERQSGPGGGVGGRERHSCRCVTAHQSSGSFSATEATMLPWALHPVPEHCAHLSPRHARASRSAQRAAGRHTAVDVAAAGQALPRNTCANKLRLKPLGAGLWPTPLTHRSRRLTPSQTFPAQAEPRCTRRAGHPSRRPSACTRRRPGPAGRRH